jgi:hypothetical protein
MIFRSVNAYGICLFLMVSSFAGNLPGIAKPATYGASDKKASALPAGPSNPLQSFPIDITGNWSEEVGFLPYVQTREPDIGKDENRKFHQTLQLPPGRYTISFEFNETYERIKGRSVHGNYSDFRGFKINQETHPLRFVRDLSDPYMYSGTCEFTVARNRQHTQFELSLGNTRAFRTRLAGGSPWKASGTFYAIAPAGKGDFLVIHGIPFRVRKIDIRHYEASITHPDNLITADRGSLKPWEDDGIELKCNGIRVQRAHFLGMIHQVDIANGSWYSPKGDDGYSHFVGDKAGEIAIKYEDGETASIPLIFGYNLWYGRPWDLLWNYAPYGPADLPDEMNCDASIFYGHDEFRDYIRDGLALTDGMRQMGSYSNNTRFIFSVNLEGKAVESISVRGVDGMYGNPLISAVTLQSDSRVTGLPALPDVSSESPNVKTVSLDEIRKKTYLTSLDRIMHTLYTFKDQLPKLEEPAIPEGYFGPAYDFHGPREAVYASSYLYYNGHECAAYIGDRGNGPASCTARRATSHYTLGIGIWRKVQPFFGSMDNYLRQYQEKQPGQLGGVGSAWSRGIGELMREAMSVGFGKFIDTYTDWLDRCLFADSQPPHWSRVPGSFYKGTERKVGGVIEMGNRENDGHGICMWGRYMAWHWLGRAKEWNERHWDATQASVDWIQWQLDTDSLFPGKRKDVLYTESECAHGDYDIYSSYNCLHGIRLAIVMARQLGKTEVMENWGKLYRRLQKGILDHLVDSSEFGPVWHTDPNCDWQDHAHKLVHLQLASDGITYTPLEDYSTSKDAWEREYLKIDLNSYRYLMKAKNYNCLRMFGYGQGMMTQSALLLDQMDDAEQFIHTMVDHAYQPNLEGWAAPEGVILHKSGLYYAPVNGYMGQDSHVADSHKALRLMLGVDDNDADHLRLVPRYPKSWNRMSIKDYPVLTGHERQKISYTYGRKADSQMFSFELEKAAKWMDIRLGPIPAGKKQEKSC